MTEKSRLVNRCKVVRIGVYLLLVLAALVSGVSGLERGPVVVLTFEGAVTPILNGYIERGIRAAEARDPEALNLQLYTPG